MALTYEQEKEAKENALKDVQQFLSHDTSTTRRQLVEVLRQRADIIEAEANTDSFFSRVLKS